MNNQKLKDNHDGHLTTLIKIYDVDGDLIKSKYLWSSLVIDILLLFYVYFSKQNSYNWLSDIVDLYNSIIPNLLGFNLGAYALLIGLASSELMKKLITSYDTKKFTTFQKASSTFGYCVLVQTMALIFAFLLKQAFLFQKSSDDVVDLLSAYQAHALNCIVIFLLNLLGIYSILLLLKVVESIFALSQAAHFYAVTNDIKQKQSNPNREN